MNLKKILKGTVSLVTIASLGYLSSCFYYLNPKENATVRRNVELEDGTLLEKDYHVTSTGFHFKWTGVHDMEQYETEADIGFEDLMRDFSALDMYAKELKENLPKKDLTTVDAVKEEIAKIAEHYQKVFPDKEVIIPTDIRFEDFGEQADNILAYAGGKTIVMNKKFQTDKRLVESYDIFHCLVHEFMHIQRVFDESYTECLSFEVGASLAKEDKAYEYSLVNRLARGNIHNMYFLAKNDKSLPHDIIGKASELMSEMPQYSRYYAQEEEPPKAEPDFFDTSYDEFNETLFNLRSYGKENRLDHVASIKLNPADYESLTNLIDKRVKDGDFNYVVYNYTGTSYQMLKDALANDEAMKPYDNERYDIPTDNISELMDKAFKP